MLASYHLSFSSSRTVRPVPASSLVISTWDNRVFCILRAPRDHTLIEQRAFSQPRGAASCRQTYSVHNHAPTRRVLSCAVESGAAACDAVPGKARRRAHRLSPLPPSGAPKSFVIRPASAGTCWDPAPGTRYRQLKWPAQNGTEIPCHAANSSGRSKQRPDKIDGSGALWELCGTELRWDRVRLLPEAIGAGRWRLGSPANQSRERSADPNFV